MTWKVDGQYYDAYSIRRMNAEIERLRAENERLRTALQRIAANTCGLQGIFEDYGHDMNAYNFHAMEYWYQDAMRRKSIARDTLESRDKHPDEIQTSNK